MYRLVFLGLAAWLALLPACRQPPAPIRVGFNPWPGYEFLYLAQDRGFYAAAGVDVTLIELMSTGDVRRAYERGQIDVMAATLVELLLARTLSNRRPVAFYATDFSNGSDALLALAPIAALSDLRGRRIGLEPGTLDLVMVVSALETAGMTVDDVTLVHLPQAAMPAALSARQVDAVQTYPPSSVAIQALPGANRLFDSSRIPGTIVDVLAADAGFLTSRAPDLARLARAFDRAVGHAASHPETATAIMARRERISPEAFNAALSGMHLVRLTEQQRFLAPGGPMEQAVRRTRSALRLGGQNITADAAGAIADGRVVQLAVMP